MIDEVARLKSVPGKCRADAGERVAGDVGDRRGPVPLRVTPVDGRSAGRR